MADARPGSQHISFPVTGATKARPCHCHTSWRGCKLLTPSHLVQGTQSQRPRRHESFDEASPGTPAAPPARQNAERAFSTAPAGPAEPNSFPMIPFLRVCRYAQLTGVVASSAVAKQGSIRLGPAQAGAGGAAGRPAFPAFLMCEPVGHAEGGDRGSSAHLPDLPGWLARQAEVAARIMSRPNPAASSCMQPAVLRAFMASQGCTPLDLCCTLSRLHSKLVCLLGDGLGAGRSREGVCPPSRAWEHARQRCRQRHRHHGEPCHVHHPPPAALPTHQMLPAHLQCWPHSPCHRTPHVIISQRLPWGSRSRRASQISRHDLAPR